jgi:hypothetical protein
MAVYHGGRNKLDLHLVLTSTTHHMAILPIPKLWVMLDTSLTDASRDIPGDTHSLILLRPDSSLPGSEATSTDSATALGSEILLKGSEQPG